MQLKQIPWVQPSASIVAIATVQFLGSFATLVLPSLYFASVNSKSSSFPNSQQ